MSATDPQRRAVVIGAGIIGVCCALFLRRRGFPVTIIDPEPVGSQASFGNAGAFGVTEVMPMASPGVFWRVPGWLFDPLGPLAIRAAHLPKLLPWLWRFTRASTLAEVERCAVAQAALLRPTYDDYKPILRDAGVLDLVREVGALTVYESADALARDALEWRTKRKHGVRCEELDALGLRRLEPALSDRFTRAVFTPDWSHTVDPHRVVVALAELLQREGGRLEPRRAAGFVFRDGQPTGVRDSDGNTIGFDILVVAGGAWSGSLVHGLDAVTLPLESERGYNTTFPDPGVALGREIIFAQRKFVVTPMAMGLRVGGAAEFAGLDAAPDYRRADVLAELARDYLPGLNTAGGTRWMGHRPTLPDTLPVISRSPRFANVLYAFGHGHLGLTQGATTGRLISELAAREQPAMDMQPYRIDRF